MPSKSRLPVLSGFSALLLAGIAAWPVSAIASTEAPARSEAPAPARVGTDSATLPPFEGVTPAMKGVWISNGYGFLADLSGSEAVFYHIAGRTCLALGEDEDGLFGSVDRAAVSADGRRLTIGASAEPYSYEFDRIDALPPVCAQPASASPGAVFDAFADLMGTHYAFFDRYGVDWDGRVANARDGLPVVHSDGELFNLLELMMAKIEDGHLALKGQADGIDREYDPGEALPYKAAIARWGGPEVSPREAKRQFRQLVWAEGIDRGILKGQGATTGEGWIKYGLVSPRIGYLATYTSGGFAARDFSDPEGDLAVIEQALDDALGQFETAGVEAVILDASMNHGGHDFISRAIASRFAAEPTLAYSKFAADAADPYRSDIWVMPSASRRFTGPVYLLTSNITVSAAEILTMSMRALSNVTHVGEKTRGALSDVLDKRLPNGWELALSNEVYLDAQGESWEGRGIPPSVPLDVFGGDDPAVSHRDAIDAIIDLADRR